MNNPRFVKKELITREVLINNLLTGHVIDIDPDGMFINVPAEIKEGASITLKLNAAGLPLVVKAIVRHSQPGVGIGIQFSGLNEDQEERLAEFIEQCTQEHAKLEKQGVKPVILMVDDRLESIKPFELQLRLAGYETILANNGVEAVKAMDKNKVDLVTTDLLMDRMNGFMLIQLIKQTQKFKNIPVAVLSATNQGDADIERATRLGIERFFMKHNTKPQAFAEEVTRILNKAKTN
jgi:CheY-like chemotaxis protein